MRKTDSARRPPRQFAGAGDRFTDVFLRALGEAAYEREVADAQRGRPFVLLGDRWALRDVAPSSERGDRVT